MFVWSATASCLKISEECFHHLVESMATFTLQVFTLKSDFFFLCVWSFTLSFQCNLVWTACGCEETYTEESTTSHSASCLQTEVISTQIGYVSNLRPHFMSQILKSRICVIQTIIKISDMSHIFQGNQNWATVWT